MSKTPFLQNKQSLAIIAVSTTLLLLLAVNILALIPMLMKAYILVNNSEKQSPIDVETVNKAIDYLNEQ